ncbi:hypothetical protein CDEST_02342 [Colletotrichum destructivum]|uniref:Uncharacterized protein n=1 Tax=Colletotrichum destructivum TaxID=34406 RepID=A0AAX4I1T6_9PEZI|nr:hypothetical protein CDEST_02342 [Colletotrichum destructivum]
MPHLSASAPVHSRPFYFRKGEARINSAIYHVARQGQLTPSPKGDSSNGSDDRYGKSFNSGDEGVKLFDSI